MRRAAAIVGVLMAGTVATTAIGPFGGGEEPIRYDVVLDNAFGLTEGADFRATGVRVGAVDKLEVDIKTARAVATVTLEDPGFGKLKRQSTCTVQPQSLIGEYYLNCEPGKGEDLPDGGTIPVEQTSGTVPPDLVASIMNRPTRERFGILLAELGGGLAARGEDLDASIRRAIPALRETDKVLEILAEEKATLQALTRDADVVIGRLADGREDVGRFVSEARDTAAASADRRVQLQQSIQKFPRFQRELRPVLRDLSTVARRQTPALRDLRLASTDLTTLLRRVGPFADATVPALRSLGQASVKGRRAVRDARDTVAELRRTAGKTTEPLRNLRFIGEHIDDRKNAVEKNVISPGGEGFTGLEAFLQYPYVQAQAINLFDDKGYTLKLNALLSECSMYTNSNGALRNPARTERCSAALGPGSPKFEPIPETAAQREQAAKRQADAPPAAQPLPTAPAPAVPPVVTGDPTRPGIQVPEIRLPGLPPIKLPPLLGGPNQKQQPGAESVNGLLDFLLGP